MLTQKEFDQVMSFKKHFKESHSIVLDIPWSRDIISLDSHDEFILDYHRGKMELKKFTYNKRYRQSIVLLRFDSEGRHTNPDGSKFDGPHLHIYREEYGDKYAVSASEIGINEKHFKSEEVLNNFLQYCHIENCPAIQLALF